MGNLINHDETCKMVFSFYIFRLYQRRHRVEKMSVIPRFCNQIKILSKRKINQFTGMKIIMESKWKSKNFCVGSRVTVYVVTVYIWLHKYSWIYSNTVINSERNTNGKIAQKFGNGLIKYRQSRDYTMTRKCKIWKNSTMILESNGLVREFAY